MELGPLDLYLGPLFKTNFSPVAILLRYPILRVLPFLLCVQYPVRDTHIVLENPGPNIPYQMVLCISVLWIMLSHWLRTALTTE